MSDYSEFFLNSKASVVQLECIELLHSSFTQPWRLVRNATEGMTVKHEDSNSYEYSYCPMRLSLSGNRDDLDCVLNVELGDLGEIIPQEIDAIRNADNFKELPKIIYRTYRSDNLNAVLYGPLFLEIKTFNFTRTGASFSARAPSLNVNRTGEIYRLPRFPALRGLL